MIHRHIKWHIVYCGLNGSSWTVRAHWEYLETKIQICCSRLSHNHIWAVRFVICVVCVWVTWAAQTQFNLITTWCCRHFRFLQGFRFRQQGRALRRLVLVRRVRGYDALILLNRFLLGTFGPAMTRARLFKTELPVVVFVELSPKVVTVFSREVAIVFLVIMLQK